MTRVHDMGGRFGDGPVVPEPETPVFHADWHKRALAVTLAVGGLGQWNLDMSRHSREQLLPQDYTRFSYYEKWMSALADMLVKHGVVSRDELAGGQISPSDLAERALQAGAVPAALAKGGPADRPSSMSPNFAVGSMVRTLKPASNRLMDGGHTRLPAYAAGAVGRVVLYHGTHILPDANAHGFGEAPEPLYAVAFAASELWAAPEHPRDEVVLDAWQSYLEAV
ncbi:MAG: nitrile hydratase subunit beta [Aliishimia sp.]